MCMQITAICILSLQTEFSPWTHSWRLFKTAHIVMLMSCQLHNSFLKKKKHTLVEINAHLDGRQCYLTVKMIKVLVQRRSLNFKSKLGTIHRRAGIFLFLSYHIAFMQIF